MPSNRFKVCTHCLNGGVGKIQLDTIFTVTAVVCWSFCIYTYFVIKLIRYFILTIFIKLLQVNYPLKVFFGHLLHYLLYSYFLIFIVVIVVFDV